MTIYLYCGDREKNISAIKPAGNFLLDDLVKYKQSYSSEGSVLIIGYDIPMVKKGEAKKIAGQLSKEIKNYLLYWLDYWNVKLKFIILENYEESFLNTQEKEYVNIILTDLDVLKNSEGYNEILGILNRFRGKEGIQISKGGRNIKIDLSLLFESNSTDLKNSATFILDNIIDILKLSNNNLGVKIEVHIKYIYDKGYKEKEILSWAKKIGDNLQAKGLKQEDIYVFAKEDENVTEQKADIIFFNKKMDIAEIKNLDAYEQADPQKKKNSIQKSTERVYVYKDGDYHDNAFYPTGWIGDSNDMKFDFSFREEKADIKDSSCIKIQYRANGSKGWAGLQWQYPPNNWGNKKESIDLTNFKKLVFFAKGEKGGERVSEFKVGGIQGQYGDSDVAWIGNIKLSNEWQKYEILLKCKNLKNIIGGFGLILTKYDNRYGSVLYLDDIYYE